VDEIYLKVRGRWCYLYRAIDRDGHLVDTMLSEHRDMAAAQAFFRSAKAVTGVTPDRVTTDGHGSYPRAIRSTLGRQVEHRTSAYKNNRLESLLPYRAANWCSLGMRRSWRCGGGRDSLGALLPR
jgi:transposase-like protein